MNGRRRVDSQVVILVLESWKSIENPSEIHHKHDCTIVYCVVLEVRLFFFSTDGQLMMSQYNGDWLRKGFGHVVRLWPIFGHRKLWILQRFRLMTLNENAFWWDFRSKHCKNQVICPQPRLVLPPRWSIGRLQLFVPLYYWRAYYFHPMAWILMNFEVSDWVGPSGCLHLRCV